MANTDLGRLRARLKDGRVTVRVLLKHPMEAGNRQDSKTGEPIPRHFLREVRCEHNGQTVLTLDWGWGVSANPYLSFDILSGKAGDRVAVQWWDNLGETGRVEGEVK